MTPALVDAAVATFEDAYPSLVGGPRPHRLGPRARGGAVRPDAAHRARAPRRGARRDRGRVASHVAARRARVPAARHPRLPRRAHRGARRRARRRASTARASTPQMRAAARARARGDARGRTPPTSPPTARSSTPRVRPCSSGATRAHYATTSRVVGVLEAHRRHRSRSSWTTPRSTPRAAARSATPGTIATETGTAEVLDTVAPLPGVIAHRATVRGELHPGQEAVASIDARPPRGDPAQPHRHAPAARRAARRAGRPRPPAGLARGAGPPALRLLAPRRDRRRGAPRDPRAW